MKKEITKNEYLQLEGLFVLAANHMKSLEELNATVASILEEEGLGGHSSEFVYGQVSDVKSFLKELEIVIKK